MTDLPCFPNTLPAEQTDLFQLPAFKERTPLKWDAEVDSLTQSIIATALYVGGQAFEQQTKEAFQLLETTKNKIIQRQECWNQTKIETKEERTANKISIAPIAVMIQQTNERVLKLADTMWTGTDAYNVKMYFDKKQKLLLEKITKMVEKFQSTEEQPAVPPVQQKYQQHAPITATTDIVIRQCRGTTKKLVRCKVDTNPSSQLNQGSSKKWSRPMLPPTNSLYCLHHFQDDQKRIDYYLTLSAAELSTIKGAVQIVKDYKEALRFT